MIIDTTREVNDYGRQAMVETYLTENLWPIYVSCDVKNDL